MLWTELQPEILGELLVEASMMACNLGPTALVVHCDVVEVGTANNARCASAKVFSVLMAWFSSLRRSPAWTTRHQTG